MSLEADLPKIVSAFALAWSVLLTLAVASGLQALL